MLSPSVLQAAAAHRSEDNLTCGRYLNRRQYLEKVLLLPIETNADAKIDAALREVEDFIKRTEREALIVTTTPQTQPAAPKPAAPAASPALAKVQELQDEVAYLRELVIRQHTELKETLTHMAETRAFDRIRTDELHHAVDHVIELLDAKTDAPRQPAALTGYVPAAPPNTVIILAAQVKAVPNKKGDGEIIHLLGGQFSTFGVPVYPEFYEAVGIELDGETPTYNGKMIGIKPAPFGKKAVVEMRTNGDGIPKPYRVIGLA